MSDLKYNSKYKPLFRTKKNIRYKHVTGGRGSGKSHALSVYLLMKTYNKGEVILYTRYTMVSASLSIIPEFYEKIEQLNVTSDFENNSVHSEVLNFSHQPQHLFISDCSIYP